MRLQRRDAGIVALEQIFLGLEAALGGGAGGGLLGSLASIWAASAAS
jgi:hypothetical protein